MPTLRAREVLVNITPEEGMFLALGLKKGDKVLRYLTNGGYSLPKSDREPYTLGESRSLPDGTVRARIRTKHPQELVQAIEGLDRRRSQDGQDSLRRDRVVRVMRRGVNWG